MFAGITPIQTIFFKTLERRNGINNRSAAADRPRYQSVTQIKIPAAPAAQPTVPTASSKTQSTIHIGMRHKGVTQR